MFDLVKLRRVLFVGAVTCPLALVSGAHAAGLFDAIGAIFGGDPEPPRSNQPVPQTLEDPGEMIDLTVRSRRQPKRERAVRREKPPIPVADPALLDPARNPDWYLADPTLRRGDIVVLKGEVLVFQGGRPPYAREDFTSLEGSKLSRDERERIGAMAGLDARGAAPRERPEKTASAVVAAQ